MSVILGIDHGIRTGVAVFHGGGLTSLTTIEPHTIRAVLDLHRPSRVVFEDSRLTSPVFSARGNRATALKIARNVGEVDAWCRLITLVCAEMQIPAHGISPERKGAKLNSMQFRQQTGWEGKSNQHERDAAMVAWPYRRVGA